MHGYKRTRDFPDDDLGKKILVCMQVNRIRIFTAMTKPSVICGGGGSIFCLTVYLLLPTATPARVWAGCWMGCFNVIHELTGSDRR